MRDDKGEAHPMPDGVRGRGRFLCSWPDVVEPTTYLSEASVRRPSKPTSSHHNSAHRHKSRVVSVVRVGLKAEPFWQARAQGQTLQKAETHDGFSDAS